MSDGPADRAAAAIAEMRGPRTIQHVNNTVRMIRDAASVLADRRMDAIRIGMKLDDVHCEKLTEGENRVLQSMVAYSAAHLMVGAVDAIFVADEVDEENEG